MPLTVQQSFYKIILGENMIREIFMLLGILVVAAVCYGVVMIFVEKAMENKKKDLTKKGK